MIPDTKHADEAYGLPDDFVVVRDGTARIAHYARAVALLALVLVVTTCISFEGRGEDAIPYLVIPLGIAVTGLGFAVTLLQCRRHAFQAVTQMWYQRTRTARLVTCAMVTGVPAAIVAAGSIFSRCNYCFAVTSASCAVLIASVFACARLINTLSSLDTMSGTPPPPPSPRNSDSDTESRVRDSIVVRNLGIQYNDEA